MKIVKVSSKQDKGADEGKAEVFRDITKTSLPKSTLLKPLPIPPVNPVQPNCSNASNNAAVAQNIDNTVGFILLFRLL